MGKIGIFFGTNSGTTRLIAKKIAKELGEDWTSKPLNINRASAAEFLSYNALVLGTPSYGDGQLPSAGLGVKDGSWQEFLPSLADADMRGKTIACFGVGDQLKYGAHFASGLAKLCSFFKERGATVVGQWSTEGYDFEQSQAATDGQFCGLVLDNDNQRLLTEARLTHWSKQVKPALLQAAQSAAL